MGIEDVKSMTWAEFELRSFGYWEDVKRENRMISEVVYEIHCTRLAYNNPFGKSKPVPNKNQFLGIDREKKQVTVPIEFLKARAEYLKKKKAYPEPLEKFKKESK